jgi:peroxiredoxin
MRRASILTVLCLAAAASSAIAGVLAVGDTVPDLTLTLADGKERKLSASDGRAVVLFFYGTWSKKAAADAATVAGLRRGREKQALDLFGVARDAKPEDVKKFADEQKLTFPQAADAKSELYQKFAEKGLPWVVVMDGKRKLRWTAAGIAEDDIDALLTELLGKREEPKKDPPPPDGAGK